MGNLTIEQTLELDVRCFECGDELECEANDHGDVTVRPCKSCCDDARQEGYEEGSEAGYEEGYSDGQAEKEKS
jgi:hypothetical protein